ncbi:hypothetical protein ACOSQ4_011705 [Xanthoceras sorbifolium]
MESAVCRPPIMLLNCPSTMSVERRVTKLRSSRSSFSLSSGSRRCSFGHVISPVILAVDRPWTPPRNDKGYNKVVVKGAVGASLVLACALGIISCSCKMNPKAIAGPMEMYQKAPPMSMLQHQFGASLALKSFLDVSVKLASAEAEPTSTLPKYKLPPVPSMKDVNAIKMEAVRQMKLGNADMAVELLRNVYEACRDEPEPAYNVEMALVEILIYQGRYEEASNCNCLKDEQRIPSDGRFPLYKAIICTMLNDKEARKWWEEFAETIEDDFDPPRH